MRSNLGFVYSFLFLKISMLFVKGKFISYFFHTFNCSSLKTPNFAE